MRLPQKKVCLVVFSEKLLDSLHTFLVVVVRKIEESEVDENYEATEAQNMDQARSEADVLAQSRAQSPGQEEKAADITGNISSHKR